MAGQIAIRGAEPLQYNGFKVPLLRNLVKRAIARDRAVRPSASGGNLNLIQWAQSPWGQQVPIHISWTLLWVSAIGGIVVSDRPCALREHFGQARACRRLPPAFPARPRREFPSAFPGTISARGCFTRSWRWPCLRLLFTAFLPKVGVEFPWVTYHWIAGIVLSISVVYHIFDAFLGQDFWSIWPDKVDIEDAGTENEARSGASRSRTAKIREVSAGE